MTKYLVIEEPAEEKSVFYNFAILNAEDGEEAKDKYLGKIDVDQEESDLTIFNLDEVKEDYYHFIELNVE